MIKYKKMMQESRFGIAIIFSVVFLSVSLLTRLVLLFIATGRTSFSFMDLVTVFSVGTFFDLVTLSYFLLPFALVLMLLPNRYFNSRLNRFLGFCVFYGALLLVVFCASGEYFFFDEFSARYNFIAVDYLIYTREVIRNVLESYSMPAIMGGLMAFSLILFLLCQPALKRSLAARDSFRTRMLGGVFMLFIAGLSLAFVTDDMARMSTNNYVNELSRNGMHGFFGAFRSNKLNYLQFYPTKNRAHVIAGLRELVMEPDAMPLPGGTKGVGRMVPGSGREKRMNLVFIVEESMSGAFMAHFGNTENLTPNLDRLADQGVFFQHMYATGTRTTRGLEAISLSVPPTPGRSIVKRPHNENLFSMASVLKPRGYDLKFLYGGDGYFDNMNYFFTHNGFKKIDRDDMPDEDIVFENAWGVSDEDIFRVCLAELDQSYDPSRPFCRLIMTTSNHRPYTYPEGRVDIPSHTGRAGAVKYADYALGAFMEQAKQKPWFDNTLFVIIADHCASVMGKVALPVDRYRIPCVLYAPSRVQPARIDSLCSQIDVLPTVFGMLGFTYESHFFGENVMNAPADQEWDRAFVSTYDRLGYYKKDRLVLLDVQQKASMYDVDEQLKSTLLTTVDPVLLDEAISYYEGAYYLASVQH